MKRIFFYFILLLLPLMGLADNNPPTLRLALLKYSGGGDWYNDVNSLHNLAQFCNQKMGTNFDLDYVTVEPGSAELFANPITYMTGHGNVVFSDAEALNLRKYLIGGGFLIINDDYGMDPFIRPALKKVFPELSLVEIPLNHPVYNAIFPFKNGMPKIHEHDNLPAKGYGLFWQGRLVALYNFEADLGDGWDDVHNDPFELRLKALQMGANIVKYAFEQLDLSMNIEEFQSYCLSKPFTTEECPFGPDTLVFKVFGKIFAMAGLDTDSLQVNLKCEPEYAIELRERYSAIIPGYHMNKKLWNTVMADDLADEQLLRRLIDHSYRQVVAKLPRKMQKDIDEALNYGRES